MLVFAGLRGPDLRFPPTKPGVPRLVRRAHPPAILNRGDPRFASNEGLTTRTSDNPQASSSSRLFFFFSAAYIRGN